MAIDRDLGRRSPPMRSPGTIDDRSRDIAPDGVPFNFYDSGRMDPPSRRFPMPTPPRMPMPDPRMPMPNPFPDPRMPMPVPPPGMGPFRSQPFDMPNPSRQGIMDSLRDNYKNLLPSFVQPAAATIDPSDYRTIIKMIEQGLDPNDYMNRGGIASLLK